MRQFLFVFFTVAFLRILDSYQYTLTIASVFKDEAPYLKEWIEYHKMMGVEHFRLYNNDSEDDYLTILSPYIQRGEVSLVEWPSSEEDLKNWVVLTQWRACIDAVNYYKEKSQWLACIDIDEYLLPLKKPDMTTFLKDYEAYPGVVLNWQCFGTSFVSEIPPGQLMIETFTLKAEAYSEHNIAVKSIVRPEYVDVDTYPWAPHTFNYLVDKAAVFPDLHKWPKNHSSRWICPEIAVINHYVHRSEQYFWKMKILKKIRMDNLELLDRKYVKSWRKNCNQVEDKRIFRFLPALKEKMKQQ
jgi:hypothetical protein